MSDLKGVKKRLQPQNGHYSVNFYSTYMLHLLLEAKFFRFSGLQKNAPKG